MKKLILLFNILFAAFYLSAQNVAINNDGTSAAASAMLDVKSTTKGFMMPRVTTAQRTAIASPAIGLLVFDTDTKTIWAYDGASWKNLYTSGGLTLPFTQSVSTPGAAFNITNTGTAIQGVSTNVSTAGIVGGNNNTGGIGVIGSSTAATGVGVLGQDNAGTGVFGNSTDGVGVKASSTNGLALQVNGNVKIAGGNTNPSNGAVLTSDASGNAVWKSNKVGFWALSPYSSTIYFAGSWGKVDFENEFYDYTNGFTPFNINAPTSNSSTFTATVDGLYHLDAEFAISVSAASLPIGYARFVIERSGGLGSIYFNTSGSTYKKDVGSDTHLVFNLSADYYLLPGDKVYVQVYQNNNLNSLGDIAEGANYRFSGRLAFAF